LLKSEGRASIIDAIVRFNDSLIYQFIMLGKSRIPASEIKISVLKKGFIVLKGQEH